MNQQIACWPSCAGSMATGQCYSGHAIGEFHKVPIVHSNRRKRENIVQFTGDSRGFPIVEEIVPLLQIRRKRGLIVTAFGGHKQSICRVLSPQSKPSDL
jgi:hypothetical protein